MALETLTGDVYIDSLNSANPVTADDFSDGVGHLQGIKNVLKKTFANITGAVTATQADLNATSSLATDYAAYARARKNRLINGNFLVFQRDTTIIGAAVNEYSADRWQFAHNTAAVINISQSSTSGNVPFADHLILSPTTADASVGAGDYGGYTYRVEGSDVSDFKLGTAYAETFTLSFWHAHTKTGTHSVTFRNSAADRTYVAEYTQSVTDTWEKAEITVTGDTSGTWLTGAGVTGLNIRFCQMVGTTLSTTAGSWVAGNYVGSSSQVNNYDSTSNYFRIANVQLEKGSAATDFEYRTFDEELLMCMRYYEKSYDYDVIPGTADADGMDFYYLTGIATAAHITGGKIDFKVPKAVVPSVYAYSPATGTQGYVRDYSGSADLAVTLSLQGHMGCRWITTVPSSALINVGFHWVAGGELT